MYHIKHKNGWISNFKVHDFTVFYKITNMFAPEDYLYKIIMLHRNLAIVNKLTITFDLIKLLNIIFLTINYYIVKKHPNIQAFKF